jgi:hypothetical protein
MQFFSQNPVFKKEYQNHGIVICQTGAKFTGAPDLSGWRDLGLQQESPTQWVKMKILPIKRDRAGILITMKDPKHAYETSAPGSGPCSAGAGIFLHCRVHR